MSQPTLDRRIGGYLFSWNEEKLEIELSHIKEQKNGSLHCQLTARTKANGFAPHLLQSAFNLTSLRTRQEIKRELEKRYHPEGISWDEILEQVCVIAVKNQNVVSPAVELWGDPTIYTPPPEFLVEPLLLKNKPNLFFGDGGTLKSFTALLLSIMTALPWENNNLGLKPKKANTLILDWEDDMATFKRRLNLLLKGLDLPALSIFYRHCDIPFIDDLSSIQQIVQEHKIDHMIIDSIGVACSKASLNEDDNANKFFAALRKFQNITSTLITHNAKSREGDRTPFGSVYYMTNARNVWEVRKQQEPGDNIVDIAFIHKKANDIKRLKTLAFRYILTDESVKVESIKPSETGIEAAMSIEDRIIEALKVSVKLKAEDIASLLNIGKASVFVSLSRMKKKNLIVKLGDDFWGLYA